MQAECCSRAESRRDQTDAASELPYAQCNASLSGMSQAAHASATAAAAIAIVRSGPPSISLKFLAMPIHSVDQLRYMRVDNNRRPS